MTQNKRIKWGLYFNMPLHNNLNIICLLHIIMLLPKGVLISPILDIWKGGIFTTGKVLSELPIFKHSTKTLRKILFLARFLWILQIYWVFKVMTLMSDWSLVLIWLPGSGSWAISLLLMATLENVSNSTNFIHLIPHLFPSFASKVEELFNLSFIYRIMVNFKIFLLLI
jgi:hypothetical protein